MAAGPEQSFAATTASELIFGDELGVTSINVPKPIVSLAIQGLVVLAIFSDGTAALWNTRDALLTPLRSGLKAGAAWRNTIYAVSQDALWTIDMKRVDNISKIDAAVGSLYHDDDQWVFIDYETERRLPISTLACRCATGLLRQLDYCVPPPPGGTLQQVCTRVAA
jgi:hypothetical protein